MQRRIFLTLFTLILFISLALLGVNLFTTTQASASPGGGASNGPSLLNASGAARVNLMTPAMMTASGCGTPFFAITNIGVTNTPVSVAVSDFNGDGKLDLATANKFSNNVSILLGDGMGGFGPAVNFGVDNRPEHVAIGDFDKDGKLDLAVANSFGPANNVSILLGDGTGGFSQPTNFAVGSNPVFVAVGDFNGDTNPDLAVANELFNSVSVLLGNGMGGFSPATDFNAGNFPRSIAVGDFNADGKPDLAVANSSSIFVTSTSISILLGDGMGGFGSTTNLGVGTSPESVALGDFNADGKPDLAVANELSNTVSILLNNGMGGFDSATNFLGGDHPVSVAVGDFNGDGKPDIAVAEAATSAVSFLLGDGMGGFSPRFSFGVGGTAVSVAVGDFNGDGKLDLVTANGLSNNISILLNDCPPTISAVGVSKERDTSGNLTIANVNDPDQAANTLGVTVNGGSTATVTGVTVSNITVDAMGVVKADVAATCGAMNANFTLKVTDSVGATATVTLSVTPTAETKKPTITLIGANPMTVGCSTGYSEPGATATDNCTSGITVTPSGSVNTGVPGAYTITYSATDAAGNTATKTRTVNVVDTTKPTLTLKSFPTPFPNDHKYRTFTIADMVASVSDGCNTALSVNDVVIEKVTSDEPDNAPGDSDGNTTNDIVIAAGCKSVQLRAERDGTKNGRVYVVTLRVKDASGNTTTADFKVSVPISQNGTPAAQDATAQTKTGGCP